jgi:hypothetical protein
LGPKHRNNRKLRHGPICLLKSKNINFDENLVILCLLQCIKIWNKWCCWNSNISPTYTGFPIFNFEQRRERNYLLPSRIIPWQSPENVHGRFLQISYQFITSGLIPLRHYITIQLKGMSLHKKELRDFVLFKLYGLISWYDSVYEYKASVHAYSKSSRI